MSELKCNKCGTTWEGSRHSVCPSCLAQAWMSSPTIITPKHDPRNLPSASPSFRSTLPDDFLKRPYDYYSAIGYDGTALFSNKHGGYCYAYGLPPSGESPYLSAGSAIPSGSAMPIYPFNGYVVAAPFGKNAHVFPEDEAKIQFNVTSGVYEWPSVCSEENCDNLQMPGSKFCVKHTT